jgi:putative Holliday junction resolvase
MQEFLAKRPGLWFIPESRRKERKTPMPVVAISDLRAALPAGTRLLGIDQGEKTLGLAISDSALTVASPLETLTRGKLSADAGALARLCEERNVGGLVIGLPINMDGSEGPRCQSVRQFAQNLIEIAGFTLPIAFWDERLSTAAVERLLVAEADMSRKRRAAVVDKMAAAYILQGALDALACN